MGFPAETIQRGEMDLKRTLDGKPSTSSVEGSKGGGPHKKHKPKKKALLCWLPCDDGQPLAKGKLDRRAPQGKRKLNPGMATNTDWIVATDGLKGK